MKHPYLQFYTGDFLHDPAVRSVSLAARGLWIDMLCLMHQSNRRGYLEHSSGQAIGPVQLARMVGHGVEEVAALLHELEGSSVYSRTDEGVIYSRRMMRDEEKREKCSQAGKRGGGNPALSTPLNDTYKGRDKGGVKGLFQKAEVRSQIPDSSSPSAPVMKFPAADVEAIYQAYPRRIAKAPALKAIAKALASVARRPGITDPTAWLTECVRSYASTRRGEDPQFTPHPATWFNAARYDDDLTHPPLSANGAGSPSLDPTPDQIAAWLDTRPEYASKRSGWKTWADVPPGFARDEFWQHQRGVKKGTHPAT